MANKKRIRWTGVGIAVQTGISTAQNITTYAVSGAVVTATYEGADPEDGDLIHILSSSLPELRDGVYRVQSVNTTAKTFVLGGFDGTTLNVTAATEYGSFGVLTFGAQFSSVQTVASAGGDFENEDTTTVHDTKRKSELTIAGAESYTFTNFFDPDDAGYMECRRATRQMTDRAVLFTFKNGVRLAFVASVGASGLPTGEAQASAKVSITLALQGDATIFAAA